MKYDHKITYDIVNYGYINEAIKFLGCFIIPTYIALHMAYTKTFG